MPLIYFLSHLSEYTFMISFYYIFRSIFKFYLLDYTIKVYCHLDIKFTILLKS